MMTFDFAAFGVHFTIFVTCASVAVLAAAVAGMTVFARLVVSVVSR